MQSKHRWYQCLEKITNPKKNSLEIFREYNHMHSVSQKNLNLIPQMWINNYKDKGIDLLINPNEEKIWFDQKVLDLFDRYGTVTFRQIAIWDINWIKIGKTYNKKQTKKYKDPRSLIDKLIQKWLQVTQPFEQQNIFIRRVDRLIVKKIFKY